MRAEIERNAEREPVCPSDHPNDPRTRNSIGEENRCRLAKSGAVRFAGFATTKAVDAFQHATTLEPSAEAYSLLGLALVQAGRLSEVTPVLRKAAHADPHEDQLYRAWGAYYLAQSELDRAASYYEKAIAMLYPAGLGFGQVDHDYSTLAPSTQNKESTGLRLKPTKKTVL